MIDGLSTGSFATSALSSFNLGVVDLAKGPAVLGSLARSTTSTPVLYLDRALVRNPASESHI
jgi:hypothetical protein